MIGSVKLTRYAYARMSFIYAENCHEYILLICMRVVWSSSTNHTGSCHQGHSHDLRGTKVRTSLMIGPIIIRQLFSASSFAAIVVVHAVWYCTQVYEFSRTDSRKALCATISFNSSPSGLCYNPKVHKVASIRNYYSFITRQGGFAS